MQKFKYVGISLLLVMFLASCGTMKSSVTTYEISGDLLLQIKTTAEIFASQGTISQENLIQIKTLYNQVRQFYLAAGDMLILVIITDDAVKKNEYRVKQVELTAEYQKLGNQLIALAVQLKILKP